MILTLKVWQVLLNFSASKLFQQTEREISRCCSRLMQDQNGKERKNVCNRVSAHIDTLCSLFLSRSGQSNLKHDRCVYIVCQRPVAYRPISFLVPCCASTLILQGRDCLPSCVADHFSRDKANLGCCKRGSDCFIWFTSRGKLRNGVRGGGLSWGRLSWVLLSFCWCVRTLCKEGKRASWDMLLWRKYVSKLVLGVLRPVSPYCYIRVIVVALEVWMKDHYYQPPPPPPHTHTHTHTHTLSLWPPALFNLFV